MKNLGDIERQKPEQKLGIYVVIRRHQPGKRHDSEESYCRSEVLEREMLRAVHRGLLPVRLNAGKVWGKAVGVYAREPLQIGNGGSSLRLGNREVRHSAPPGAVLLRIHQE